MEAAVVPKTRARPAAAKAVPALLACLTCGGFGGTAHAQAQPVEQLVDLSLEELLHLPVTSVFRRAEPLADAPASIYVISHDDIRRSGAATLAEALRLAPNLQVARVDARTYAISARGFNNAIANKLLVMIDGRTVYSPVFSGVFWDQQDVMLEDVERIEVVSGPGAAQWGANAVNGVINVITRPASGTQGAFAAAAVGNFVDAAAVRYGGPLGEGSFRVYAKGLDNDDTERANGISVADAWRRWQAGLRADWSRPGQSVVLIADAYDGKVKAATPLGTQTFSGASLLARFSRQLDDTSDIRLQAYIDHAERDDVVTFRDRMRLYDVEGQYAARWKGGHKVMFGGGYRWAKDRTERSPLIAFIPAERDLRWGSVLAQDTFPLAERLEATAGVKLESNVYTGWETLPSARLVWKVTEDRVVWGAVSRAVRAPARLDREFYFPGQPPFIINGGPDFVSEIANVIEVGYRVTPGSHGTLSASVFHNVYDKLRSGRPAPAQVENTLEGDATGLEMWGGWQPAGWLRLTAGLTLLDQDLRRAPGSPDPTGPSALGNDPRYQGMLRAAITLPAGIEVDVAVRRVGALPDPAVPAYTAVDARVGWRLARGVELSLGVQNAFDPGHPEFNSPASATQVPRAGYFRVAWRL
jgi:iron complex outermembrane receptor protein